MQKLSDEELINQAAGFSCGCDKCLARVDPPRKELLARLERGRKAIEYLSLLVPEINAIMSGEMGKDWADYFGPLFDTIIKAETVIEEVIHE